MSLISEFLREATNPDFTIDGLIVLDDDTALAITYDGAESAHFLMLGERGEEGICFAPHGAGPHASRMFPSLSGAIEAAQAVAEERI